MKKKFIISLLIAALALTFSLKSDAIDSLTSQLTEAQVKAIYASIAGEGKYTIKGLRASYYEGNVSWTIIGANAPITNRTIYPTSWPVKGNLFEVLVLPEPITNYKILPFTENIVNGVKTDTISLTAARNKYEPASFVIRSGEKPLKNVTVTVCDLKAKVSDGSGKIQIAVLPKENIDIRVVKCWYQAGIEVDDTIHKTLTPELLLHDDDLVRVDYDQQVNIIKNFGSLEDSARLKPFSLARHQNKQIWMNIYISSNVLPGTYTGFIKVSFQGFEKILNLKLTVLPYVLPKPILDYNIYYLSKLVPQYNGFPNGRYKNEEQMYLDFKDMVDHGIDNFTLWLDSSNCIDPLKCINYVESILKLRKKAGIPLHKPLLIAYDIGSPIWLTEMTQYHGLFSNIVNVARQNGIQDVYIHTKDEVNTAEEFNAEKPNLDMIHEIGAKTFTSGWLAGLLKYAASSFDLMIVNGMWGFPNKTGDWSPPSEDTILKAKQLKKILWLYNYPQGGLELPETYRINYGIQLWLKGFDGECTYCYQSGDYPWDDFSPLDYVTKYRPHNMVYPTVNSPVPTLQWEGLREGIDDLRYVSLLLNRGVDQQAIISDLSTTSIMYAKRRKLINKLISQ